MTYSKIYNQLDKNGLIEKILVNSNFDNIGLIQGIKHLESFLNSSTFNNMKYWQQDNANKTVSIVCIEYAKLQIENNAKFINKFQYMINEMEVKTYDN